jgi:subtilisin family serine protease
MLLRRLSLLLAVGAVSLAAPTAASADTGTPIAGQYIVVLKAGSNGRAVAADHARSAHADVLHTYDSSIHGYSARLSSADLAKVKADSRVSYVVQDEQGKPTFAQTLPTEVNRIDAEMSPATRLAMTGSFRSVDGAVAVFDSGIDTRHPDLNVAGGVDCLDPGTRNDGTYNDAYGHGTHVAGILGAKDDLNGVVGVAPGVRLWAVRVIDSIGSGSTSGMLCGINWINANAASFGIKVVNASMQLFGRSDDGNCGSTVGDVLHQAICASTNAGITWVFASGNSTAAYSPIAGAGWNEVLAVTASADSNGQPNVGSNMSFSCGSALSKGKISGTDDTTASFSNYAAKASEQARTVAAPGVCIYSTFKGQTYNYLSGTSMSAPAVTGTVELCIVSGQCTGTVPQIIQKMAGDAAAYNTSNPGYGFKGDPLHSPVSGRYIGYQVRAGLY